MAGEKKRSLCRSSEDCNYLESRLQQTTNVKFKLTISHDRKWEEKLCNVLLVDETGVTLLIFFADTKKRKRQVKEKLGQVVHTNVCRFAQNVNSTSLFFCLLDKDKNNINTN